jgi:hypothetical protein
MLMELTETLARAITKVILKIWLGDRLEAISQADHPNGELVQVRQVVSDLAKAFFSDIDYLYARENIDRSSLEAATHELKVTLEGIVSAAFLCKHNLDEEEINKALLSARPPQHLFLHDEQTGRIYRHLIIALVPRLRAIAGQLPGYQIERDAMLMRLAGKTQDKRVPIAASKSPDNWRASEEPMALSPLVRTNVFISYSHVDKEWMDRLKRHLKPLVREGRLNCLDDTRIRPGDDWKQEKQEIRTALDTAQVAVLLISADFFASDFIDENELPPLLAAAEAKGTRILPVILSASRFARHPDLACFQAVNALEQPLRKMLPAEQEEVLDRLAQIIESAFNNS